MGRRVLMVAIPIAAVAISATASASPTRTMGKSITVNVPVPATNQAEVVSFTVKANAKGKPTAHVLNDAAFGSSSAIIAIGVPTKRSTTNTYSFVVWVRRFLSRRALSRAQGGINIQITAPDWQGGTKVVTGGIGFQLDGCSTLAAWDKYFEGSSSTIVNGTEFTLQSLRPESEQDSPPEEVLDNVVALLMNAQNCSTPPEGDDAGNK